jgi:hypothetical protein
VANPHKDLSSFLKKRSNLEDNHAKELRRLCRVTFDGIRSRDSRQGSYAAQFEEVIRVHERIADNEVSYGLNLHQMSADLENMAYEMERGRKQWKANGLAAEEKVQEAEKALDKAQQKYHTLAENYDAARTGDKTAGRHFGLRVPKSADKHEEDLHRKLQIADEDYKNKVENAKLLRQELQSTLRPQALSALQQLIQECDSGVTLQMQKFVSFNEKLILGSGLLISPLGDGDPTRKSLRDIVAKIDNDFDFKAYVAGHAGQVPGVKDIKYEQHPTLRPANAVSQPSVGPISPVREQQQQSASMAPQLPPPQFPMGSHGAPPLSQAAGMSVNSLYESPRQSQPPTDPYGAPSEHPYPGPSSQYGPAPTGPYGPGSYAQRSVPPPGPSGPPGPPFGNSPSMGMQPPGSRGNTYPPPAKPIFGVSLNELFIRDQSPVPLVVYQCIQAVELFGLDHEGIYRVSGNTNQVSQLKAKFNHEPHTVDFRNPDSFFHDVNNPANLLKAFLRELPDPLLPKSSYGEFLEAATLTDDTPRRDRIHAAINDLPDPNYATLRALVLVRRHTGCI